MSAQNVGRLSTAKTKLLYQKIPTGERPTCAARVGKPSVTNINLSSTKKSTVEKRLMSVADVGNPFWMTPHTLFIREFTPEKGLMSAVSGKFFRYCFTLNIRKFILEKGPISAVM